MSIKYTTVNLHAFSINGYCLPTFQKGKLKVVRSSLFKKKQKFLTFKYWENSNTDFSITDLKETTIQVK